MADKKQSKNVQLPAVFIQAAAQSPEEALAYMMLSAFGVSLQDCVEMVKSMVVNKDTKVMQLCMTAAVQIRGNTTFVSRDFGDCRTKYPKLIIEGDRPGVRDTFNFGGLHVCGHVLALATANPLGARVLAKAGNCVNGSDFPKTDAGAINSEIKNSWTTADLQAVIVFLQATRANVDHSSVVDGFFAKIQENAAAFSKSMTPKPAIPARS